MDETTWKHYAQMLLGSVVAGGASAMAVLSANGQHLLWLAIVVAVSGAVMVPLGLTSGKMGTSSSGGTP